MPTVARKNRSTRCPAAAVNPSPPASSVGRLAITVRGIVQGVGFRPFVYNTARALGLGGWVLNEADTVRIEVQGEQKSLDGFLDALSTAAAAGPSRSQSRCGKFPWRRSATRTWGLCSSSARARAVARHGPRFRPIWPPAASVWRRFSIRRERRYRYPFTNCTHCGPALVDHRAAALRPATDGDGRLSVMPRVPGRVRRPDRPPLPRPADRLSALRAQAAIARCPGAGNGASPRRP